MSGVKKFDSLKSFLKKVMITMNELMEQISKDGKKGSNFRTELNEMRQLNVAVQTALVTMCYKVVLEEDVIENQE